jgi:hypothetical protein
MIADHSASRSTHPIGASDSEAVSSRLAELAHPVGQVSVKQGRIFPKYRGGDVGPLPPDTGSLQKSLGANCAPAAGVVRTSQPGSADNLPNYGLRELAAIAAKEHEHSDDPTSAHDQDVAICLAPLGGRRHEVTRKALILLACVVVAGGVYTLGSYKVPPPLPSRLETFAHGIPSVNVPAALRGGKVIQDRVPARTTATATEQPLTPSSSPGWLRPSLLPSSPPSKVRPSGSDASAPFSGTSNAPKPVRSSAVQSDANDQTHQPMDVTSSAGAANRRPSVRAPPLDKQATPLPGTASYFVQLSAQQSEAQALASFRLMKSKYPSGFRGRSPIIEQADNGSKGVPFRTLVGPFASAADATQFCNSLKAAGGQCGVKKSR